MPILSELNLYPIKSCAGISLREATLTPAGLMSEQIYDREWMVVDAHGVSLTQRTHPRLALITPRIKGETLELRAPGMLRLEIPLGLADPNSAPTLPVRVWYEHESPHLQAYDCDDLTAAWFSNAVGVSCRLVRFHPQARRVTNSSWTDGVDVPILFSDGYPMLVISSASLADLNQKLTAAGRAALPMNRFRPNIVIDGVEAYEEDFLDSIRIGAACIKPSKPCPRCVMPAVDQATGVAGPSPLDILQTYRANPKVDGGITFGINALLGDGDGTVVRVGQEVGVELAF